MSKKANPTIIGAFVLGAIALAVAGVLMFGSGKFLTERQSFVLYFEGSVKGLTAGAPVNFRGVRVGSVTDIRVLFDREDLSARIPVYIELEPERFTPTGNGAVTKRDLTDAEEKEFMDRLIEHGLRAQLQMQSLVTGQLMIQLDFLPNTPVRLVKEDTSVFEIPTIPSDMQEIERTLDNAITAFNELDLDELGTRLASTADGIDKLVNSPDLAQGLKSFGSAMEHTQRLTRKLDTRFEAFESDVKGTLQEAQSLLRHIDQKVGPAFTNIDGAVLGLRSALDQANQTLSALEGIVAEDSVAQVQLVGMLDEVRSAARSLRILTDYLAQNPGAVLRGKTASGGK